jgi:hypothetical protein
MTWRGTVGKLQRDFNLTEDQVKQILWDSLSTADHLLGEDSRLPVLISQATSDEVELDVQGVDGPEEEEEEEEEDELF